MSRRTSKRMDKATGIGPALFGWHLWLAMSDAAKVFWLHLYASDHARGRCPIGLWKGGLAVMAEETRRDVATVTVLLGELEQLGAVEFDRDTLVLRLVELPDRCERPHNGDVLRGWWTKFLWLPACPVRDRHVATLRWLVGTFTRDHQEAWDETFGRIESASRSNSAPSAQLVHRVPHGVRHRQGEGEGEGSGSLGERDPALVVPTSRASGGDALDQLDRERTDVVLRDPAVADVVRRSLERYGPRAAGGAR